MTQAALMLAVYALGVGVCLGFGPGRRRPYLSCALAFPVGTALLGVFVATLWVLWLPYRFETLVGGWLLLFGVSVVRTIRRGNLVRSLARPIAVSTAAFVVVAVLASKFSMAVLGYEPHYLLAVAKTVGSDGAVALQLWPTVVESLIPAAAHSMTELVGVDFLHALGPLFGASLAAAFCILSYGAIATHTARPRRTIGVVALTALALFTTYEFSFLFVRVADGAFSATYLYLAIMLLWTAEREQDDSLLAPALLCALGFMLCGTLAPLLLAVILAIWLPRTHLRSRSVAAWLCVLAASIFYLYAYVPIAKNSAFSMQISAVGLAVLVAIYIASQASWGGRVRRYAPFAVGLLVLGLLVVALVTKSEHMTTVIDELRERLAGGRARRWAWVWTFGGALSIATLLVRHRLPAWPLAISVATFLLYVLFVAYGEPKYKASQLASSSRLVAEVAPLFFSYLLLVFAPYWLGSGNENVPRPAPQVQDPGPAQAGRGPRQIMLAWVVSLIALVLITSNVRLQARNLRGFHKKYQLQIHRDPPVGDALRQTFDGPDAVIMQEVSP